VTFDQTRVQTVSLAITLTLVTIVSPFLLLGGNIYNNKAYAMGDPPGVCDNRYDATITSMTIDNGVEAFDPISNPNPHFDSNIDNGYTVTFTLHTASQSTNGNTLPGTTWYRHTSFGFANGSCVNGAEPNKDITSTIQVFPPNGIPDDYTYNRVEWGTFSDADQIIYSMTWQKEPLSPIPRDTKFELTVSTEDGRDGSEIFGYYTVLYQNRSVVTNGFTPATFTLDSNEDYVVQVQDYDNFGFDHWFDTGSTNRNRIISISADTKITAVYRDLTQPLEGRSSISVSTVDSNNNPINGYYTTIWQNGVQLQSGFSPYRFIVNDGQSYQVAVADYGSYVLDHWSDRSHNRFHNAQVGDTLTAIYRTS
jgi:hypothetical protein